MELLLLLQLLDVSPSLSLLSSRFCCCCRAACCPLLLLLLGDWVSHRCGYKATDLQCPCIE